MRRLCCCYPGGSIPVRDLGCWIGTKNDECENKAFAPAVAMYWEFDMHLAGSGKRSTAARVTRTAEAFMAMSIDDAVRTPHHQPSRSALPASRDPRVRLASHSGLGSLRLQEW